MGNLDPGEGGGRRMESLEAHHQSGDPLDEAVVLFQYVVEIFNLPHRDGAPVAGELQDHVHRLQAGSVCTALIDHNLIRHAVGADRSLEEAPGSGQISAFGKQKIEPTS